MGQGSELVYISHPFSEKVFSAAQALRMALISPCAVGSFVAVTVLAASATITPSFTIRAAKGPPAALRTFSVARSMARFIKTGFGWLAILLLQLSDAKFRRTN